MTGIRDAQRTSVLTDTQMRFRKHLLWVCLSCGWQAAAQQLGTIAGAVTDAENRAIAEAVVTLKGTRFQTQTSADGRFTLKNVPSGDYTVVAFAYGKELAEKIVSLKNPKAEVNFTLQNLSRELDEVVVQAEREKTFGVTRLKAVENFGIYAGKKTEVIVLKDVTANLSTNNARQAFAKIPSLNIWESDRAGLQLSIGARGLNPNRTANFNTRQNGYDIAAESVGYPESYYTPPLEALEKIEVVRGAASLQFGPQFGGMVNFVYKKPETGKPLQLTTRQTLGSWGFFNSFNSLAGQTKKLGYYSFYQYKTGGGWRPNSGFDQHTAYVSLQWQVSGKLAINPEYTFMTYVAQQPGGLTDFQFERNPRQSNRSRNWFKVNWNLLALNATYRFSDRTQLNWRNFLNLSGRESLGNLERINLTDNPAQNRTLIRDKFQNAGSEMRLLHRYQLGTQPNSLLVGGRFYRSRNPKQQGDANNSSQPDFNYLNPNDLENSDYMFDNANLALFAENIFALSEKFSITPGFRWEYIRTDLRGYYKQRVFDSAGNLIVDNRINEQREQPRGFLLAGLGLSYKWSETLEGYANVSQNYRAVTFSDLRIVNPSVVIDPNLMDERGFNADLGIRGNRENWFNYDVSLFWMRYGNRIDLVPQFDSTIFNERRFRTNVGTSRHVGMEAFAEMDFWRFFGKSNAGDQAGGQLSVFAAVTLADARYVRIREALRKDARSQVKEGNFVPFAPQIISRGGVTFGLKGWKATCQAAYTSRQFSNAANTNTTREPTAVLSSLPGYYVMDFSASYGYKFLTIEGSINNLTGNRYFTRRAESYPGPGIIPADGRAFYLTLQGKF